MCVTPRPFGAKLFAAEGFAEEVRRDLVEIYGKEALGKGGYSVRTTLDPKLQIFARQSLARGLIEFDRKRGFRGPVKHVDLEGGDWGKHLEGMRVSDDVAPWRLAIVTAVDDENAEIGLQPSLLASGAMSDERETGKIPVDSDDLGAGFRGWHQAWEANCQGHPGIEAGGCHLRRSVGQSRRNGILCKFPM